MKQKKPTRIRARLITDPDIKAKYLSEAWRHYSIYGELGERVFAAVLSYKMGEALSTTYQRRKKEIRLIGPAWIAWGKELLGRSDRIMWSALSVGKRDERMDMHDEGPTESKRLYAITEAELLELDNLRKHLDTAFQTREPLSYAHTLDARKILENVVDAAHPIEFEPGEGDPEAS